MMIPIPVLIAAGAIFLLLVWLLLRRGRGRDLTAPPTSLRPRMQVPTQALPPGLEDEVRALIAERRHIDAIKRVREETGLGLMEAKTLVDAIERGGTPV
ncbi:MAG: ribosomal protein L7/L12 [Sphingomonas sp.]